MFEFSAAANPRQRLFDNAWNGLKSQGFERSMKTQTMCAYRGRDGRKCAIGWSIPEDAYREDMDIVYGGSNISSEYILKACGIPDADDYLVLFSTELQKCHDVANSPFGMERNLREFAVNNQLTIPENDDV